MVACRILLISLGIHVYILTNLSWFYNCLASGRALFKLHCQVPRSSLLLLMLCKLSLLQCIQLPCGQGIPQWLWGE